MAKLNLTSNITFLYYKDLASAKKFMGETLGLEIAFDPGWACVYRLKDKSFLGAVDVSEGSIEVEGRGGSLVSLTVNNIEEVHEHLKTAYGVEGLSEIKVVKDIALKSCFFTDFQGYKFEIQQFTSGDLSELF